MTVPEKSLRLVQKFCFAVPELSPVQAVARRAIAAAAATNATASMVFIFIASPFGLIGSNLRTGGADRIGDIAQDDSELRGIRGSLSILSRSALRESGHAAGPLTGARRPSGRALAPGGRPPLGQPGRRPFRAPRRRGRDREDAARDRAEAAGAKARLRRAVGQLLGDRALAPVPALRRGDREHPRRARPRASANGARSGDRRPRAAV